MVEWSASPAPAATTSARGDGRPGRSRPGRERKGRSDLDAVGHRRQRAGDLVAEEGDREHDGNGDQRQHDGVLGHGLTTLGGGAKGVEAGKKLLHVWCFLPCW